MCVDDFERSGIAEGGGVYAVEGMGWGGFAAFVSKTGQMEGEPRCQVMIDIGHDINRGLYQKHYVIR